MGRRRKGRELALQLLYQWDLGSGEPADGFWENQGSIEPEIRGFAEDLFRETVAHRGDVDALAGAYLEHWRPERMAVIDRNIIRIAIYELRYREDIPGKVTINEWVSIAKKYSTEQSGAFVNGILDRIFRNGGRPAGVGEAPADGL